MTSPPMRTGWFQVIGSYGTVVVSLRIGNNLSSAVEIQRLLISLQTLEGQWTVTEAYKGSYYVYDFVPLTGLLTVSPAIPPRGRICRLTFPSVTGATGYINCLLSKKGEFIIHIKYNDSPAARCRENGDTPGEEHPLIGRSLRPNGHYGNLLFPERSEGVGLNDFTMPYLSLI